MAFLSLPINSAPKIKVWDKPYLVIVLYNGNQKWTATTNIADLIPEVSGMMSQFKPSLQYLLIDENNYTDTELASLNNLVAIRFPKDLPHHHG